jgi:hypothetical protein
MQIHGRAKLGPAGRLALCESIERGLTLRQAAAAMSVSPATAHRWWHRYAVASLAERQSLAWAADRCSRPHRSPRLLAPPARASTKASQGVGACRRYISPTAWDSFPLGAWSAG